MMMIASRSRRFRGVALVYVAVTLLVLIGFCSLAVDVGRMQLVKTELQRAADAASRAAASGLAVSVAEAQNRAVKFAGDNLADGTSVSLNVNADIEFGTWNTSAKTFTVLAGSARSGANAVRVWARRIESRGTGVPLLFASIVGKSRANISVSAITMVTPGSSGYGIVGMNRVEIIGNATVDSYDSSLGSYTVGSALQNGSIASNGNIDLTGIITVNGDANAGVGMGGPNNIGIVSITGSDEDITSPLVFDPPVLPTPAPPNLGQFNNTGNSNVTLTSGVYRYSSFNLLGNQTLNITGDVTVYVSGSFTLTGNINTAGNKPANFKIRMLSASPVNITGNTSLYLDLYAPRNPITITGNNDFYGRFLGKSIKYTGNGKFHYDESIPSGGSTGSLTLVK